MKKSYYAIIPANVRYDNELIDGAKLLYGEITALCNQEGYCWANNSYFADLYGVSKVTISKWVNQLKEKGYIDSHISYKEGTKEIDKRYLRIVNDPIKEKLNTPIKEKFKDNNTSFNTTFNNTTNKEKKDFTAKIKDLLPSFSSIENFNQLSKEYWDAIRDTRKTGIVAKSVIYNNMKKWSRYDSKIVEYALKEHIDNHVGKKEEYTIGIMRNTTLEEIEQAKTKKKRFYRPVNNEVVPDWFKEQKQAEKPKEDDTEQMDEAELEALLQQHASDGG